MGVEDTLAVSQESAQSHHTSSTLTEARSASNAEEDLSKHHRKKITQSKRGPKRRSERLLPVEEEEQSASPVIHGYNTRSQPLTRWQQRKATGKVKAKDAPPKKKAPWKTSFQPRKNAKGPSKKLQQQRDAKRQQRLQHRQADEIIASLELDNPLDDISWDSKKRLASYWVLKRYYEGIRSGLEVTKEYLVQEVSDLLDVSTNSVLRWCIEYELNRAIAESKRGKHSKSFSPILDAGYEDFRDRLKSFIRENSLGGSGKPNLTIKRVAGWVNEDLGLTNEDGYSERTVGDWMHYLGFDIVLVKKTLYVDGHEREDVVADRERFGKQLDDLRPKLLTIDDETLEVQANPEAKFILISQDEKIHHSNDVQRRYWSDKSFSKLPTKSQGRTIMTSDFLSEVYGFVKYSERDPLVPGERTGSVLDVSADGYYNSERCQVDFQECSEAVEGLTAADGQRLHCVFLTDRSPIHCKWKATKDA
ncbi:hypothetical protein FOZ62_013847 [Perkinsus olseni]|uniref:Uncharacterized protein n=1 Tax=Perkinsus olseni TaxID=32597 RepID=A0A7J6SHN1_PEROL|nr:hypothetical protein FOZ62_013847 [Perkinsus olseni]